VPLAIIIFPWATYLKLLRNIQRLKFICIEIAISHYVKEVLLITPSPPQMWVWTETLLTVN